MGTNGLKEDYNPWAVSSIWDFNYFCCPECEIKSQSKQEFVDHVSAFHTWALGTLRFISDLDDIDFPSGLIDVEIKKENISYSEQYEYDLPTNEFEIEDSKPCIADLDQKLIKSNPESKKRVKKEGSKKTVKEEGSKDPVIRKKKWKCPSCDKKFTFKSLRQIHIDRVHEEDKKYKCSQCDYKSAIKASLQKHVEAVHEKLKPFKCELCPVEYYRKQQLQTHVLAVHEGVRPHICDVCGKGYPTVGNLTVHKLHSHEGLKRYPCVLCDFKTNSTFALKTHTVLNHEIKYKSIDENNISEICKDHPEVAEMLESKYLKKTFCKICEIHVYGKLSHINEYHKDKNAVTKCPNCDKSYPTYAETLRHITYTHDMVPCSICGAMVNVAKLNGHMQQKHTALGERRHKCTLCPKSFVSPKDIKDHMNTHTGEKPYVCRFCGKRSASNGTHRGHERSHEGHRRTK